MWASMYAERTMPRSAGDPVRWMTAKASAIGAKELPKSEIVLPAKSSRKSRSASGLSRTYSVTARSRLRAVISDWPSTSVIGRYLATAASWLGFIGPAGLPLESGLACLMAEITKTLV